MVQEVDLALEMCRDCHHLAIVDVDKIMGVEYLVFCQNEDCMSGHELIRGK